MSDLITGQFLIEPKIDSVKYVVQSVCFIYLSNTNFTQNPISKITNTECLIKLLINYQMKPKPNQ